GTLGHMQAGFRPPWDFQGLGKSPQVHETGQKTNSIDQVILGGVLADQFLPGQSKDIADLLQVDTEFRVIAYGEGPQKSGPFGCSLLGLPMAILDRFFDLVKINRIAMMDHGQGIIGHGHFPVGEAEFLKGVHKVEDIRQYGLLDLLRPLDQECRFSKGLDGYGVIFHCCTFTRCLGNSRERYINISNAVGPSLWTQRVCATMVPIPPSWNDTLPSLIMGRMWVRAFAGSHIMASFS